MALFPQPPTKQRAKSLFNAYHGQWPIRNLILYLQRRVSRRTRLARRALDASLPRFIRRAHHAFSNVALQPRTRVLLTLARNSGARLLGADLIPDLAGPIDLEQPSSYRCTPYDK